MWKKKVYSIKNILVSIYLFIYKKNGFRLIKKNVISYFKEIGSRLVKKEYFSLLKLWISFHLKKNNYKWLNLYK